jgi:hypothetical protein
MTMASGRARLRNNLLTWETRVAGHQAGRELPQPDYEDLVPTPIEWPSTEPGGAGDESDDVPPIFNDLDNYPSPLSSTSGCRRRSFIRDDQQSEDEPMTDIRDVDGSGIA